jgi:hypothetical protein
MALARCYSFKPLVAGSRPAALIKIPQRSWGIFMNAKDLNEEFGVAKLQAAAQLRPKSCRIIVKEDTAQQNFRALYRSARCIPK